MDTINLANGLETTAIDWVLLLRLWGLLLAGIFVYSVYKARKFIADNTFTFKKFFDDGHKKWIWAFSLGAIIEVLLVSVPDIDALFTNLLGINVVHSLAGAVFLGIGLIGLVHNQTKDVSK